MIPAGQILARVRTRHESLASTRWSDEAIYKALNEGLDDLSLQTRFYERYATIPIRRDTTYYDLRGFTPETPIALKSIWSTSRQEWLQPTAAELLDRIDRSWDIATGDPQAWWTKGIYWVGVWPKPTSAISGYLRVYFAGMAPHFGHAQAVLADLPNDFVPALEDYALYELAAQDGETERALRHWGEYGARVMRFKGAVDKRMTKAGTITMGGRR